MPTEVIGEHTIVDGRFLVLLVASSITVSILDVTFWVMMDLQDHCAVVTLVVSNCLKKLMSHSCPYRTL